MNVDFIGDYCWRLNFCVVHSGGSFFDKPRNSDLTFFSEVAALSVTQCRRQICPSSHDSGKVFIATMAP